MKKLSIITALCLSFLYLENEQGVFIVQGKLPELSFTENRMIEYANKIGIKYVDVMVAQSRIETGWYSSKIFKEGSNLFGMKLAKRRKTTALGEHRKHAKYSDWTKSVEDYKLWQEMVLKKVSSKQEYLSYIGKYYAENPNYLNLIKKQTI
jgi:flagellum-specific peptidoglycan hydrolase FlgJ